MRNGYRTRKRAEENMVISRKKTRVIRIGNVHIGGNHPVAIQSMTKVKTSDLEKVVKQIYRLAKAGCEIARLAVKDSADASALKAIKRSVSIPIVADIHFDWRLAIAAAESGVDKIRLNPGNIYKNEEVRKVAECARSHRIPIRIGVNSGSVRFNEHRVSSIEHQVSAMVKSALNYIKLLEKLKFSDRGLP
jgi:(E)-4-hydroxy-3-methylbut-2-enyl-diphosphate synthase